MAAVERRFFEWSGRGLLHAGLTRGVDGQRYYAASKAVKETWAYNTSMSWLAWLAIAVIVAAVAAVTGIQPKGGRPVARTGLMGMARLALLALVLIFAYLAFRARSGG
jgi:hypothetical protein